jgi:type I restriction enzyme M protein
MPENPGIPSLFRDIFKNAYLPYRDPETLRAFLKIIDEFTYEHSERLGDAFEYLLSVLGSQGDAGQFRTPRHIIDFMVEVIDPKKNETILDPACGTAGFLISSYKHILRVNTDAKGNLTLTPDDKGHLAKNFKGYDISPDMVRLSLVNLYLHGFTDPHIYEYDTLTSEEKWNEYADVILANPPFMSPKGGIKPHKRFSVRSKRSEVLFVDYMAEHLTPSGRAGIIVPEGIIFQSQNAYKQLRKMLVEEYLVAVISLPAGVFNPYSGVKTSILILDKPLAKQSDTIAFFKVENDGFNLGAQRRKIEKNDLPQVEAELADYLSKLRARESVEELGPAHGLIVPKEKIAANGEYNLSGERYRESNQRPSAYPYVELGEVVDILDSRRRPITKRDRKPGPYPYYGATGVLDHVDGYLFDEPLVLVGEDGARWGPGENSAFTVEGKVWVNNHAHVLRPRRDRLLDQFIIEIVNEADLMPYITGVTVPKLNQGRLRSIRIPLPPLEVQKEIVAEIEGYQKVIDGARAVLDNYHPHITIDPDWPMVELGKICSLGGSITADVDLSLPYIGADSIESNTGKLLKTESAKSQRVNGPVYSFDGERLLYSKIRPYLNKLTVVDLRGYCSSDMYPLQPNSSKVQTTYLATYMLSDTFNDSIRGFYERASIPKINRTQLFSTEIPLPPLATQQAIVAEIEAEQKLVNANRELIERMEKKIQAVLARVWEEES